MTYPEREPKVDRFPCPKLGIRSLGWCLKAPRHLEGVVPSAIPIPRAVDLDWIGMEPRALPFVPGLVPVVVVQAVPTHGVPIVLVRLDILPDGVDPPTVTHAHFGLTQLPVREIDLVGVANLEGGGAIVSSWTASLYDLE